MSIILALAAQAAGQTVTTFHNPPAPVPQATASQPAQPTDQAAPASAEPAASPASAASATPPAAEDSPSGAAVVENTPAVEPATTPTAAQTGPILWRNIASGMTVADLRALYPQGQNVTYKNDRTVLSDVPVIEGCEAKVNVMHAAGVVNEIVMRGEGSLAGRCSLKLVAALSGKYGESLEKDKVRGSLFAREGKNYVWTRDGVTLQFKRYTRGAFGGGGLFAASWELRYSANAAAIDL